MKTFNLAETRIPNLFYTEMYQKENQDIPEHIVPKCYDSLFMAMARFLDSKKTKDNKVALIIRDLKNNFKMAMMIEYHKGENEETQDKGNWSVVLTFDPADAESAVKYYNTDSHFNYLLASVTREMHGFKYSNGETVPKIVELLIELLINWLNEEARPGEEIVLDMPGYFIAQVEVDGDKKILGITPGENIKNVVKGDMDL